MQSDDPRLFLATAPADRPEVHLALAAVLASGALFLYRLGAVLDGKARCRSRLSFPPTSRRSLCAT